VNPYSYFHKIDLNSGDSVGTPQPTPYYSYICGNKDLTVGYNISFSPAEQMDTAKIDTFGLPGGVPKSLIIQPDNQSDSSAANSASFDHAIMISPNPTHDFVILRMTDPKQERDVTMELINSLGYLIKEATIKISSSGYKIDLGSYPEGLYFIDLKSGLKTIRNKVVKLK